jgi:prophage regulatory protein
MEDDGVLRFKQMPAEVGLTRSTIYDKLNPGKPSKPNHRYDPTFPKPFKLSRGRGRHAAVGFSKAEVRAWVRAQMATRDQGAA